MLYKYPQAEFPYTRLLAENQKRDKSQPEFELVDTGIFDESRYFDVAVEYAKADAEDLLIRVAVTNRGPAAADLDILPMLWFRNTWRWGRDDRKPSLKALLAGAKSPGTVLAQHWELGDYALHCADADELLFTENETNSERLHGTPSATPFVKDAFHRYVVNGERAAVNPSTTGTKAAARFHRTIKPGETITLDLRLAAVRDGQPLQKPFADFETVLKQRRDEADEFYGVVLPDRLSADEKLVARLAFAGMLSPDRLDRPDRASDDEPRRGDDAAQVALRHGTGWCLWRFRRRLSMMNLSRCLSFWARLGAALLGAVCSCSAPAMNQATLPESLLRT
jgi:hypothetical protein